MALQISNQKVFVSKVERVKSKQDKWFLKAQASFMSRSKDKRDGKEEYVDDKPLFARLICFSVDANKIITNLPEKKGFIEISGKLTTESYKNEKGEEIRYNQIMVFTAKLSELKKDKEPDGKKTSEETTQADEKESVQEPEAVASDCPF